LLQGCSNQQLVAACLKCCFGDHRRTAADYVQPLPEEKPHKHSHQLHCKRASLLYAAGRPLWEFKAPFDTCTLVVPPASPGICLFVTAFLGRLGRAPTTGVYVLSAAGFDLLASHSGSTTAVLDAAALHVRGNDPGRPGSGYKYDSSSTPEAGGRQLAVVHSDDCFVAAAAVAGRLATSSSCDVGVQLLQMPPYERRVLP
jgi:hypothetical protein